jgi:transcriptional regulator with XRE-family HTH domain
MNRYLCLYKKVAAMDDLERFGKAIRARRRALDLSQEALAEKIGLHRNYIWRVEAGQGNVSLKVAIQIVRALELNPGQLFSLLDEEEKEV